MVSISAWHWLSEVGEQILEVSDSRSDSYFICIHHIAANYKPLTKTVLLIINQGGIQHHNSTTKLNRLFKEHVLPWLMESAGVTEPVTGRLELHYAENTLKKAGLYLK